jgi:hypothetical protein
MIDKTLFNKRSTDVEKAKDNLFAEIESFKQEAIQKITELGENEEIWFEDFLKQFENANKTVGYLFNHFLERNGILKQIEHMNEMVEDKQGLFKERIFDDVKAKSAKLRDEYLNHLETWDDTFLKKFDSNLDSVKKSRKEVLEAISRRDLQKNYKNYFR